MRNQRLAAFPIHMCIEYVITESTNKAYFLLELLNFKVLKEGVLTSWLLLLLFFGEYLKPQTPVHMTSSLVTLSYCPQRFITLYAFFGER